MRAAAPAALVVAGPALLVLGWLLLISNVGRGANDTWAVGHVILFIANACWIPSVLALRAEAGADASEPIWTVAIGLVLLGSLAIAGQLAIDLVAWIVTTDAAELTAFFRTMHSRTVMDAMFYVVGPPLLFAGLVVAALSLGRARSAYRGVTFVVAGGLAVVLVGAVATFSYVILAGYVVALFGFVGVSRLIAISPPMGTTSAAPRERT